MAGGHGRRDSVKGRKVRLHRAYAQGMRCSWVHRCNSRNLAGRARHLISPAAFNLLLFPLTACMHCHHAITTISNLPSVPIHFVLYYFVPPPPTLVFDVSLLLLRQTMPPCAVLEKNNRFATGGRRPESSCRRSPWLDRPPPPVSLLQAPPLRRRAEGASPGGSAPPGTRENDRGLKRPLSPRDVP